MRLEQLHYLDELDRTHSMNLASEILFVSQQNISKAIRNLEDELGVQLLNRSSKGITLTPAGQKTVATARSIFESLDKLDTELEMHRTAKSTYTNETLRIGYMESAINQVEFTKILLKFHVENSKINFYTYRYTLEEILKLISNGLLDIGIVFYLPYLKTYYETFSKDLVFEPIHTLKYYICCSNFHPLSQKQSLNIEDIKPFPLAMIQNTDKASHLFYEYLMSYNYTPSTILNFNDTRLLFHALEESPSIVHLSISTANTINRLIHEYNISVLPCSLPADEYTLCFLYKQSIPDNAKKFKNFSRQYHKIF